MIAPEIANDRMETVVKGIVPEENESADLRAAKSIPQLIGISNGIAPIARKGRDAPSIRGHTTEVVGVVGARGVSAVEGLVGVEEALGAVVVADVETMRRFQPR